MSPVTVLDYLDGHLSPEEHEAFERRLASDPDLRAELASLVEIRAALRSGVSPEPVGQARTLDALRSLQLPWYARWNTGSWVALAGAATLAIGVILTLRSPEAQSTNRMMLASDRAIHSAEANSAETPARMGSITLSVESLTSTLKIAGRVARGGQGSLEVRSYTDGMVEAELRLPSGSFDRAWESLVPLGRVEATSVFESYEAEPGEDAIIRVRLLAPGDAASASHPSP